MVAVQYKSFEITIGTGYRVVKVASLPPSRGERTWTRGARPNTIRVDGNVDRTRVEFGDFELFGQPVGEVEKERKRGD